MYASANPVDWFVHEMRFGFYDHDMSDFDTESLRDIVTITHRQWKTGKRVLVRCQAGLNRSGLVMALILIREGHTADEAIHLIRSQRGQAALCNRTFERWLRSTDMEMWRS
jgi:protein-tyrosine phosphatase